MVIKDKEYYMKQALKEAKKAENIAEVPVGAIIVKNGEIIARAYNRKEVDSLCINHAEILAIKKASKKLKNWRLENCEMYVTLEPCTMCAGAIIQARIKKIYIGTEDKKTGAAGSVINIFENKFNHQVEVEKDIMKEQCSEILKKFFKELRDNKKAGQTI